MGIDVSTTGAKALLIDEYGTVIGTATTDLALSTPQPLWSQQEPADWWHGTVNSIRRVLNETDLAGDQVAGVGLTLLDAAREVLRPAIHRAAQEPG